MKNDIDKIKAKIKKLLALAKSPNPNEAASALKMAQEMIAEYKVAQADIGNIDIGEEAAPASCCEKPPRYECRLIAEISGAFGCKVIRHVRGRRGVWRFIGLRHRAQIAAYIGQVLIRKLKSARTEYIKTLYRVRSKYRKTQRADDFCLAWVNTVTKKLSTFAGISNEEQKAIELYVSENHPHLEGVTITDRSFGNDMDYLNGARAGKGVQLQHGVGIHSHGSLLLGGAV